MAEKPLSSGDSSNGKPVLVTCSPSSNEPSPSGPSELQPYPPSRLSSSSSQSSVSVPVRLDVLLFLLNSAVRGAQYALPTASVHSGHGSPSPCHHGPPAQHVPNCCSCPPMCHGVYQPRGTHQYEGGYGSHAGVSESRDNRHDRVASGHQSDGKSWPGASSMGSWKIRQPAPGWQEKPRGEGMEHDSWQGRRQNFERSWGDRRRGVANSPSWKSSTQDRRKEGSAFESGCTSSKRTHEGGLRPPWDAKRPSDNERSGWQKSRGMEESASFPSKPADNNPADTAAQDNGEDWETDYDKSPSPAIPGTAPCSSHSNIPADPSREDDRSFPMDPPKSGPLTSSSPPELASKSSEVVAAAPKLPVASDTDQSKNSGFVSYLKNLYADLPRKSGSEGSSPDLVIDTDVESTKLEEEQQLAQRMEPAGKSKSCE